jgi:predicted DsbA family dithiol-disulfide isomerase
LAHKLAIHHPLITADCVEVSEFPDMIQKYNISGVPKTVVNETIEFVGAQSAQVLLDAIKKAGR